MTPESEFYGSWGTVDRTFVEIPDDRLLLQEVLAELLTEAELQHVVCEGTDKTHTLKPRL